MASVDGRANELEDVLSPNPLCSDCATLVSLLILTDLSLSAIVSTWSSAQQSNELDEPVSRCGLKRFEKVTVGGRRINRMGKRNLKAKTESVRRRTRYRRKGRNRGKSRGRQHLWS